MRQSTLRIGLLEDFLYQYDNDLKHTAHKVQMRLLYNARIFPTLPQSPDLYLIEYLQCEFETRIRKRMISSKAQLKEVC